MNSFWCCSFVLHCSVKSITSVSWKIFINGSWNSPSFWNSFMISVVLSFYNISITSEKYSDVLLSFTKVSSYVCTEFLSWKMKWLKISLRLVPSDSNKNFISFLSDVLLQRDILLIFWPIGLLYKFSLDEEIEILWTKFIRKKTSVYNDVRGSVY